MLAADVLRCGNSALYARGAPVASVKQAVGRIGAKDVARLALASGLGSHALAGGKLASLRRKVWLDALASAMLAQDLGRARGMAPDVAFSAGLLHDFGKVVALACIEELLERWTDVAPKLEEEWVEIMDRYHVEMGVVMAAKWDLPPVIADVVSLHHSTERTAASDPAMVEVVVLVDKVVGLLASHTRLGAQELEGIAELSPRERDRLVLAIEALPGFVASFESAEVWRGTQDRSLVAAAPQPAEPVAPPASTSRWCSSWASGSTATSCSAWAAPTAWWSAPSPSRRTCSCSSRWPAIRRCAASPA